MGPRGNVYSAVQYIVRPPSVIIFANRCIRSERYAKYSARIEHYAFDRGHLKIDTDACSKSRKLGSKEFEGKLVHTTHIQRDDPRDINNTNEFNLPIYKIN